MLQLRILSPDGNENWVDLKSEELVLGRDAQADIALASPKISRRHARIGLKQGRYWLTDLGSSNGVRFNGRLIDSPQCLSHGSTFSIGPYTLIVVDQKKSANRVSLIGLNPPCVGKTYQLPVATLYVGRDSEYSICIEHKSISRKHASIFVGIDDISVRDLGSSNGVFVNDQKVTRATLKHRDVLRFGNVEFEVSIASSIFPQITLSVDWLKSLPSFSEFLRAPGGLLYGLAVGALALILGLFFLIGDNTTSLASYFEAQNRNKERALAELRLAIDEKKFSGAKENCQLLMSEMPFDSTLRGMCTNVTKYIRDKAIVDGLLEALKDEQPERVLPIITAVASDSPYHGDFVAARSRCRNLYARQSLDRAQGNCAAGNWRACHRHAISSINAGRPSGDVMQLIKLAEGKMVELKLSFIRWEVLE